MSATRSRSVRYDGCERRWYDSAEISRSGNEIERDEREHRREHDDRDPRDREQQQAADHLDQHLARECRQRLHVRGQARDEHARALALEERHRQPLEVLVRGNAERSEEALARARGADDDEPLEQRPDKDEHEVGERRDRDRRLVAALDPLVDRVLEQERARDGDERRADDAGCGERDQAAVRAEEDPRAAEDRRVHAASNASSRR